MASKIENVIVDEKDFFALKDVGKALIDIVIENKLFDISSKSDFKRQIKAKAFKLNDKIVLDEQARLAYDSSINTFYVIERNIKV